jgi:hypothetical protein
MVLGSAMKKIIYLLVLLITVLGCEERPSYKPIKNTLPEGGIEINYDPQTSLTNIQLITDSLSTENATTFERSLSWYGTESNYGFQYIHGKTSRELVDIVNCLKTSPVENQDQCVGK